MSSLHDLLLSAAERHQAGDLASAGELAGEALRLAPENPHALALLGSVTCANGRACEGADLLRRAVAFAPDDPAILEALVKALTEAVALDEAAQYQRHLSELSPQDDAQVFELARLLKEAKRLDEAKQVLQRLMENPATQAQAQIELASVLRAGGEFQAAEKLLAQAMRDDPLNPARHADLARLLADMGRLEAAEAGFRHALKLDPQSVPGWIGLAYSLQEQNRLAEAEETFRQVIALEPNNRAHRGNLALCLLAEGKLEEGWDLFEDRDEILGGRLRRREFKQPLWRGEPLHGKTILVWREQGVGDLIRYLGCIPDLVAQGAKVILEVDERLVSLATRSFPDVQVLPANRIEGVAADYQTPIASLPFRLRRKLDDFPTRRGYLVPDPPLVAKWRERLAALPGRLKVGLAWTTGIFGPERLRDISPVASWAPLLRTPEVSFVNLHYGAGPGDLAEAAELAGKPLAGWPDLDLKNDFENVAALLAALDLVVTVGVSINDQAGALGTETWLLLKTPHYDMLGTSTYPWYPATRVFTRSWSQSWLSALSHVAMALRERLGEASGRNAPCPCGSGKRFKHCCGMEGS